MGENGWRVNRKLERACQLICERRPRQTQRASEVQERAAVRRKWPRVEQERLKSGSCCLLRVEDRGLRKQIRRERARERRAQAAVRCHGVKGFIAYQWAYFSKERSPREIQEDPRVKWRNWKTTETGWRPEEFIEQRSRVEGGIVFSETREATKGARWRA